MTPPQSVGNALQIEGALSYQDNGVAGGLAQTWTASAWPVLPEQTFL